MKKIITNIIFITVLTIVMYSFYYKFAMSFHINKKDISYVETNEGKNNLEEYVIGVVACEMPALYNEEALKAQAVSARTYALAVNKSRVINTDTTDQCYITKEEMHDKWKNDYDTYYNKIKKAVDDTTNLVMKKDNKVFKSFYFAISNGKTEDSMEVFKEENITSVSSSFDTNANGYKKEIKFSKQDLINVFGDFNEINIISRNDTNHVTKINVDNKAYTGIEFRKLLGLRSTDFNIENIDNQYIITTYGYGHGVGMSQYGANYLASINYDYKKILNYYYGDIKIEKI